MNWTFHDNYKTEAEARSYGDQIIKLNFSKGAKVVKNNKDKKRPFELYVRPFSEKQNG
jgi:hypothetical protein